MRYLYAVLFIYVAVIIIGSGYVVVTRGPQQPTINQCLP